MAIANLAGLENPCLIHFTNVLISDPVTVFADREVSG